MRCECIKTHQNESIYLSVLNCFHRRDNMDDAKIIRFVKI